MLEKTYDHHSIEPRVSQNWSEAEAFRAGRVLESNPDAPPFAMVIPPPNVTGSLHMGHALNNTLQDVLARYHRMCGYDVLWQPGTDHAGIATQSLVERQLMEHQKPGRRDLGREKFLEKIWEWKEQSGNTIINQLKRLGASCDWSRERFTLGSSEDDQMSKAVIKAFVDLYNEGLIYKDKRLVNWDPKLQTAISDLEVISVEIRGSFEWSDVTKDEKPFDAVAFSKIIDREPNGHLYYFKYLLTRKVEAYDKDYIVVATTRPETMLGDMAVAVNPKDKRYACLVEARATVTLPLIGRSIPIIADDYADLELGTGAVKITPAHDFNDFEVGRRHHLEPINIFTPTSSLSNDVPEAYRGQDRFEARKQVVIDLEAEGLLQKIEPHVMKVPYGDRSNVVIEPYLTDQWYADAKTLAQPALKAVAEGKTKFKPDNWQKVYNQWLENIQPWCISRQLWWGHQIPAWYGFKLQENGTTLIGTTDQLTRIFQIFVASNEQEALAQAKKYYKTTEIILVSSEKEALNQIGLQKSAIWRDEDVLDTWFSSALWPFSTMGWPENTPELQRYYPTSTLITGFDIIFFWVARMMMMGLHFEKDVPFRDVYIHALVRDEKGAKMSKSKGNVVDPLSIMENYGADALRFTMAAMAAQGRDVKLSLQRIEGYRNFATKLWNAARFTEMNGCVRQANFAPGEVKTTLNKWLYAETNAVFASVADAIEGYRFNDAATDVYRFVWNVFCDWYLEFAKPVFSGEDEAAKTETQAMTAWALDRILLLLHPFMPFITEELWTVLGETGPKRESLLCLAAWPERVAVSDDKASAEIRWMIDLISEIRSIRSEMNVPAALQLELSISDTTGQIKTLAQKYEPIIHRMARLNKIVFAKTPPAGSAQFVLGDVTMALVLANIIDFGVERDRLKKEIAKLDSDIKKIDMKFADEQFMAKARESVIDENRERRTEAQAALSKLATALQRIETIDV